MMKFDFPGPGRGYSLHNHSNWSDGSSSLEKMCRAAKAAGLKVFGMSDHWVVPPMEGTDSKEWSMDLNKLDLYVETLQKLKKELDDENFTLKIALEVDFFFENIDEVLKNLKNYPLDYLIGSVHYSGIFGIDHDIADWDPLTQADKDEVCEIYWKKLAGAAKVKEFAFIGHLDLPKKFGLIDNSKYLPHALKILDILAENGGAFELNTAGFYKQCGEQYPSFEILKAAADLKIPVCVNADAHDPDHVIRGFEKAYSVLEKAGYRL